VLETDLAAVAARDHRCWRERESGRRDRPQRSSRPATPARAERQGFRGSRSCRTLFVSVIAAVGQRHRPDEHRSETRSRLSPDAAALRSSIPCGLGSHNAMHQPHWKIRPALQRYRVRAPRRGARSLLASFRQRREGRQCRVQEPTEPNALAFAQLANPVQAVVPVTRADPARIHRLSTRP